jgi:hypothetical protein
MYQTAKQIRSELAAIGLNSRNVSVTCAPSYQIRVETKATDVKREDVRRIVEKCYYASPHGWLCCWVDGQMLSLPNPTSEPRENNLMNNPMKNTPEIARVGSTAGLAKATVEGILRAHGAWSQTLEKDLIEYLIADRKQERLISDPFNRIADDGKGPTRRTNEAP